MSVFCQGDQTNGRRLTMVEDMTKAQKEAMGYLDEISIL